MPPQHNQMKQLWLVQDEPGFRIDESRALVYA